MRVEGIYSTIEEVEQAVHKLREQGYTHNDLTIVVNRSVRDQLDSNVDAEIEIEKDDKSRTVWESIKNFFTMDDMADELTHQKYTSLPDEYKEAVRQGQIALLVDKNAKKTKETTIDDEEMIEVIEAHRTKQIPEDEILDREISTNHFDEEFKFNKSDEEKDKN